MRPIKLLLMSALWKTSIAISTVCTAEDFIHVGPAVTLTPKGRRVFLRAYEQRMDGLVTHPLFGYRVNYRRVLEIQARLLARVLQEEAAVLARFSASRVRYFAEKLLSARLRP